MKRIIAAIMLVLIVFSLGGCFLFEPVKSSETLLEYLGNDENVVAARVWTKQSNDHELIEIEAPEDQLGALVEEIRKTPIASHFGHTDYFYSGQYGIELTLSDGTYLIYDCTCLVHSKAPYDADYDGDNRIKRDYIEDLDKNFWNRIEKYFPGMDPKCFLYGW